MDEPTALLQPVSTVTLAELLSNGPLPLAKGLELMGVIAGQVAKLHANQRVHGLLTPDVIHVSTFESGLPVCVFSEPEATRDMSESSDQFALGVLCFQVLIGRFPKANETLSQAMPEAPTALDRLVQRLMAPNPADRMNAAGAQRQLADMAGSVGETSIRPASPLGALPLIKRGVPIGIQKTDAHAWVNKDTEGERPRSSAAPQAQREGAASPTKNAAAAAAETARQPVSKPHSKPAENPFSQEEATVVPRATAPDPPPKQLAGPALEDEPTQFEPIKRPPKRRGAITDRADTPPPPPIPTPMPMSADNEPPTTRAAAVTVKASAQSTDETGELGFEPSRSDLPGNTGDHEPVDPRLVPAPRKKRSGGTPAAQLMATLGRQPPWVWGAAGVGLAFFVLLLIALAR